MSEWKTLPLDESMRRGMPKPGDIVMTTEAPRGEVAQRDSRKADSAQRVITLRGKPDLLHTTFRKCLLRSNPVQEELRSRGTGTPVAAIRQSERRKVSLPLPPLAEQKAIAAVLEKHGIACDLMHGVRLCPASLRRGPQVVDGGTPAAQPPSVILEREGPKHETPEF